jgi:hypothetical protein
MDLRSSFGTILAITASMSLVAGDTLLFDNFECGPRYITGATNYFNRDFPLDGISKTNNPSPFWVSSKANALRDDGWLYFGTPLEFKDREFVRFHSRSSFAGDLQVTWTYRSAGFGGATGHEPVLRPEAVDLWLRHVTQYDLYVVQFDRTNNHVVAKRKVPAKEWTGPDPAPNHGVYYELKTDAENPGGVGQRSVPWPTNLSSLKHDSITKYFFKAQIRTLGTNVQIKLWRAGQLVASWTDRNDGAYGPSPSETFSDHLRMGYFTNVLDWKAEWGQPITRPGSVGFRADNNTFWIDDIHISDLESNSPLRASSFGCSVVLDWNGISLESSEDLENWSTVTTPAMRLILTPSNTTFYRVVISP